MINNIQTVLDSLGLTAQKRAIHVQFSNQSLNTQLFLQRIDGQDQINHGSSAELICLSTNAHITLKQFIGCQVAVDTVTDRGELFRRTGIITQASQGQSDGALTLYKLTLEDPTSLLKKRRNSRVFVSKSVVEVIEILFKEWQQNSPLFAASLSLDLSGLQLILAKLLEKRRVLYHHNFYKFQKIFLQKNGNGFKGTLLVRVL